MNCTLSEKAISYHQAGYAVVPYDGGERVFRKTEGSGLNLEGQFLEPRLTLMEVGQKWSENPDLNIGCNFLKTGLVAVSIPFSALNHYAKRICAWRIPFTAVQLRGESVTFYFLQNPDFSFDYRHKYEFVDFAEVELLSGILEGNAERQKEVWVDGRSLLEIEPAVMPEMLSRWLQGEKMLPLCDGSTSFIESTEQVERGTSVVVDEIISALNSSVYPEWRSWARTLSLMNKMIVK